MANGNPQFGTLDLGQVGGTRAGAGQALGTFAIVPGRFDVKVVEHKLAQQGIVFEDNLGFAGQFYTMLATIRANSGQLMNTILAEIEQRKNGQLRDAVTGKLGAWAAAMVKAVTLTDVEGNILSLQARLRDWRQLSRRQSSAKWAAIVRLSIEFRLLG